MLAADDVRRLEECLDAGGVALFPADTVYGLACDPEQPAAVRRLYEIKGRPPARPAAVLFGSVALAWEALPDLLDAERDAAAALLPGPVTLLVPNRARRFPLACGPQPDTLGLRVPRFDGAIAALGTLSRPLLQSSANRSGEPDVRRLADVDPDVRAGADLVLDGGDRPGTASTVVDLRAFAGERRFEIVREGALSRAAVAACAGQRQRRLIASSGRRYWRLFVELTTGKRRSPHRRAPGHPSRRTPQGDASCPICAPITSTDRSPRSTPRSPRRCAVSSSASSARWR